MIETIHEDYLFQGHTYMHTSFVDFYDCQPDGFNGGYWIGQDGGFDRSLAWSHTLPEGLQVPPDRIKRAKLWIDAEWVDTDGNAVSIQETWDWNPLDNFQYDNTMYSLTSVGVKDFWNNGFLNVEILAGEGDLRVDQSVLMLDYAVVPEPATALLFGLGLAGAAFYRRRKKTK